jgi:hypothetical protein
MERLSVQAKVAYYFFPAAGTGIASICLLRMFIVESQSATRTALTKE